MVAIAIVFYKLADTDQNTVDRSQSHCSQHLHDSWTQNWALGIVFSLILFSRRASEKRITLFSEGLARSSGINQVLIICKCYLEMVMKHLETHLGVEDYDAIRNSMTSSGMTPIQTAQAELEGTTAG